MLAPLYSDLLARVAQLAAPLIERDASAQYRVRDGKIAALRRVELPAGQPPVSGWQGLWDARVTANGVVLAAAILATPGFSSRRRRRALLMGMALLATTHLANLLTNALYTQLRPITVGGELLEPAGSDSALAEWLNAISYFFDSTGAGLFPLGIYAGVISAYWGHEGEPGRRGPGLSRR